MAIVSTIVKYVGDWTPQKIMATRFLVDFILCTALCVYLGYTLPSFRTLLRLVLRGCSFCVFITCFWAQLRSCLPLGDGVVVMGASFPFFLVLLCKVFLGDEIPKFWPWQMLLCTLGALLVNKPLAPDPNCPASTAILPLLAAFFAALMSLMARGLKETPAPMLMLVTDACAAMYAIIYETCVEGSFPFPRTVDSSLGLILVSAVVGWVGLLFNVECYQTVSAAAVATVASYFSVPINYLFQVLVFHVVPDRFSVMGACLCLGTCVGGVCIKSKSTATANEAEEKEQMMHNFGDKTYADVCQDSLPDEQSLGA